MCPKCGSKNTKDEKSKFFFFGDQTYFKCEDCGSYF